MISYTQLLKQFMLVLVMSLHVTHCISLIFSSFIFHHPEKTRKLERDKERDERGEIGRDRKRQRQRPTKTETERDYLNYTIMVDSENNEKLKRSDSTTDWLQLLLQERLFRKEIGLQSVP